MENVLKWTIVAMVLAIHHAAFAQLTAKPEKVNWTDAKFVFTAADGQAGASAKIVDDSQAAKGKAVAALLGQGRRAIWPAVDGRPWSPTPTMRWLSVSAWT